MAIPYSVMKKVAKKLAKMREEEESKSSLEEILEMSEDELRARLKPPEKTVKPLNLSEIEPEKLKKAVVMEKQTEGVGKIKVVDFTKMGESLVTVTRVSEEAEKVKHIPFKAHQIPKQYIKKIPSKWRPPRLEEVNLKYELIPPFAYARVKWEKDESALRYYVIEPYLTEDQRKILDNLKELLIDALDINVFEIKNPEKIRGMLKKKVDSLISEYGISLTKEEYDKIMYYIFRDFLGLEKIEPLMHDPALEDISCDGVKVPIYVYHRKYASLKTNIIFEDEESLNKFVIRLAQKCGKHISVAEPLLDAALPDGSRVQATFSAHRDIAMKGSTFTIRKFTKDPLTIVDLLNFGTLPAIMAAYLWLAVEYGKSILVAGGTATGKTTFLGALSMFIPPEKKIVSIEDTPEIRLPHEHWVQKVVRTGFGREDITGRKMGEVTMYDLLRAALRERPDEIIVGEVRGTEAYVLFQGMATGHPGMATIHADSVDAVLHRLQTPPINLPVGLLQHLNIVIVLTKARVKGVEVRRVKELTEVVGLTKEFRPIVNQLMKWDAADDSFEFVSDKSYVLEDIIEEKGVDEASIWAEIQRRASILEWMQKNNIRHYLEVGKIIRMYYTNPEEVLKNI